MSIEQIDVYQLCNASQLTPIKCEDFSEAAAVCLDYHNHPQNILLTVEGDLEKQFHLVWKEVNQQMRDSRMDMDYTVESGAYCLAMIVIERITGMKVTRQSQKRTGFDYWLGEKDVVGIKGSARLEVSGNLKGNKSQIKRRLREKIQQTKKSDNLNLPAYVVVVEFSHPIITIRKR